MLRRPRERGENISYGNDQETDIARSTSAHFVNRVSRGKHYHHVSTEHTVHSSHSRSSSVHSPSPLSDISLRPTSSSDSSSPPPRRSTAKSKGKLLSVAEDVALAQVRLEHLEAVEKGEAEMVTESVEGAVWRVVPSVPAWWPRAPLKE